MFIFTTDDKTAAGALAAVIVDDGETWNRAWLSAQNIDSMDAAARLAREATALTGRLHIATDAGANISPRYDVAQAPSVGDAVSYAYNGDSYEDGHITHVTDGTQRIVKTSTGSTYYRRRRSGAWFKKGGPWRMVKGHTNRTNRER